MTQWLARAMILAVGLVGTVLAAPGAARAVADTEPPADTRPVVTVNEFLPRDRSLSECLSVLPKPGCGSEARGGWAQTSVFLALIGGLAVIGTRIVLAVRRRDRPVPDQPVPDQPVPDQPVPDQPGT